VRPSTARRLSPRHTSHRSRPFPDPFRASAGHGIYSGRGPFPHCIGDYAISQQVLWEYIITEIQKIAKEQGVDKELEKKMDEEMKNV